MGVTASEKAGQILENVEYITAIELLCAVQAVEFRGKEKLGKGTRKVYEIVRGKVPMVKEDRVLSEDIEKVKDLIRSGAIGKVLHG